MKQILVLRRRSKVESKVGDAGERGRIMDGPKSPKMQKELEIAEQIK